LIAHRLFPASFPGLLTRSLRPVEKAYNVYCSLISRIHVRRLPRRLV
jgi:hypothetical protein